VPPRRVFVSTSRLLSELHRAPNERVDGAGLCPAESSREVQGTLPGFLSDRLRSSARGSRDPSGSRSTVGPYRPARAACEDDVRSCVDQHRIARAHTRDLIVDSPAGASSGRGGCDQNRRRDGDPAFQFGARGQSPRPHPIPGRRLHFSPRPSAGFPPDRRPDRRGRRAGRGSRVPSGGAPPRES